ncbi:MAG: tRNA (N(6)-L-threonylcarbamoyladenosine(37)-C(2))-methylthiotransferase MtaB [Selenomonadales bacterium]|nr:tRNA (N(6)-L-threonylcarbamoyladenosine(37)-C(2))-methylthiotransferase MtaB [Selenomonadales bacterium]MEE1363017.1 tRNA (N(6)-L-threonylcarbamoyladenosine(37)-C(2))-methylthiotransferase MtaB [Selenomonadaceae bacterium]
MSKTVAFITLGCKVNQFETELMEGLFKQKDYKVVPNDEKADIYVINTCSVTSFADKKSRQLIRRSARLNENAVIAVTGCYAQAASDKVAEITGVKVVLGTNNRHQIVDFVEAAMNDGEIHNGVTDIMKARDFEDIPMLEVPARTRAFLKIQEGCTNFCSYCIIPFTRGPVRSRKLASVKSEAEKFLSMGFKEIVFTGIHLGAYGRDFHDGTTLADAARTVLELDGLQRLRLGSLESIELSEELLTMVRENPKFSHHLHLPLQAGSDYVLKRMNRHYNREEFRKLIENVKNAIPGVAISTDIIVGFPGETEEMFAESLDYIRSLGFSRVHVFPYSPREGTPAASMPDQIPDNIKKERVHRLQQVAEEMTRAFHEQYLGTKQKVLWETRTKGVTDGVTDTYIRVYTKADVIPGEITEVKLERLYEDGVWGISE